MEVWDWLVPLLIRLEERRPYLLSFVTYTWFIVRIWQFKMKESKKCKVVCRIDKLSEKSAKVFKSRIKDEYHVNMYFTIMKSLLSSIVSQMSWISFYQYYSAKHMVKANFLDWILTDCLSCFPWFCRILDNLPVAVPKTIRNENGDTFSMFDRGFLIGGKASVSCSACALIILSASSHLGPNT